ncbi:MAG: ubiquitin carboxyl-terminal hydrolase, partial [Chlamydiae bacterium]|nr:ubiquitin carboxyl-terminal hydrolase [Chlamydiota bacterium]
MSFNISGITAAHQPSPGSGAHEAAEIPPFCLNDTQIKSILGSNPEIANNPVTGIANFGGNDCWANALIQSIASNPQMQGELRKMEALFSMSNEPHKVHATNQLCQAVQILIDERREGVLLSRINSYQIRLILARIIGEAHVNPDVETQCDASEVYNKLIEIIESLYVENLAKCSVSDRGRFIQGFKPIFQTVTTTVRNVQILEHLDGKEIRGEFFLSDQLWEFSERNPQHSDSLSVCYNSQMTKTELTDTRLGLNAVEIKPLLTALVHKTDEIKKSGLPLEEKRRLVEERECAVFEQLMQSCFFQPEMDSGETWHCLDPANRKLAKAKVLNTIKYADRAHENIFLCVTKREFNPETFQFAKMTYRKECIGDYGSFQALKELPVPMLEKFSIPKEFLGEECSYELTSFIIHSGGEYGSGGHYTTFQKLGGIWYNCNDSVVKQASEWQLKEAIQLGYQFSYSKAPHVDPNALKVRAPISADEVLQRRQALQADLSTPFDFRSAQSQSQRQFKDSANSFSFDESEIQILRDLKNLASTSSRSDDFQEHFVALPDSIRSFILDEIRRKVSSSASSVKKMQSKNHSEEGRKLLDKDLKLLSVVFHKNGGSFGDLDFSAHQGLVGIYDMLVANLYVEPLNLAEVHKLFYSPDFK